MNARMCKTAYLACSTECSLDRLPRFLLREFGTEPEEGRSKTPVLSSVGEIPKDLGSPEGLGFGAQQIIPLHRS